MKNNTAEKINHDNHNVAPVIAKKPPVKRTISGSQFKAVQKAVESVVGHAPSEAVKAAVVKNAVYGLKVGERGELLLQVESERIVDPRHVEVKMVDGGNRRYTWNGTTGQAARLKPGQVVLIKASAVSSDENGMQIKHCRVLEIG